LVIRAKAGERNRLYGSITNQDIADAIEKMLGEPFDRRKIELEDPIRSIGTFTVPVRVARSVITNVTVNVESESGG
jgi:large subunit ribosomal protein L9